jgi:hypothetical protein
MLAIVMFAIVQSPYSDAYLGKPVEDNADMLTCCNAWRQNAHVDVECVRVYLQHRGDLGNAPHARPPPSRFDVMQEGSANADPLGGLFLLQAQVLTV